MDQPATRDPDIPPISAGGKQRNHPFQVRLDVAFDQRCYALAEGTAAQFLVEFELARADDVRGEPVATEARLVVEFMEGIVLGDAWKYRPHERHFGTVERRRNVYSLGPIEAGKVHELAFEICLPPTMSTPTLVANVACVWQHAQGVNQCKGTVYAVRSAAPDTTLTDRHFRVLRVFAVLDAIRNVARVRRKLTAERANLAQARTDRRNPLVIAGLKNKVSALRTEELQSRINVESARLALARTEGRDPPVIAAIEQQIAQLEREHASAGDDT